LTVFITQNEFEHVFKPEDVMREIMRVLKPRGTHIFTAPKHKGMSKIYPQALINEEKIEYLHPE
jgi:2-polyprenyl-3-methyl-5-hydroxy-6-metoxy-1,4-benzoquinol methylase